MQHRCLEPCRHPRHVRDPAWTKACPTMPGLPLCGLGDWEDIVCVWTPLPTNLGLGSPGEGCERGGRAPEEDFSPRRAGSRGLPIGFPARSGFSLGGKATGRLVTIPQRGWLGPRGLCCGSSGAERWRLGLRSAVNGFYCPAGFCSST